MKKTSKRYEIEKFWYEIASQKVWKYTHWRYETTLKRYEMMSKVWKNTNNTKVWNRCTRYEKCAQGMKNVHKVYNNLTQVWNAFLRYETRVFLKNSAFSYLYGSVSYLFGYENIGCFSLMASVPRHLPNKLEYKVLCCISVHYQSRMTSNGIAITPSHPLTVQAGQYEGLWGHSVFRIQ